MADRNIPKDVKLQLRKEVNWGCPVRDCGSPFLTYHHFEPPFAEFSPDQEHDPKGIIALCLGHAKMADIGVFTNEQLREMKRHPYLSGGLVSGRLEWLRKDIVVVFGGITFINANVILRVRGRDLLWIDRDPSGHMLLNMDFPSHTGGAMLAMDANDWDIHGELSDLNALPSQRSITVKIPREKFSIQMTFEDSEGGNSLRVLLMGEMLYPLPIVFDRMVTAMPGAAFSGTLMRNVKYAIVID